MRLDSSHGNLVVFGKASKKATGCNLSLSGIEEKRIHCFTVSSIYNNFCGR